MRCFAVLLLSFALFACGGDDETPDPYVGPALACDGIEAQALAVLSTNCERCHNPDNAKAGFGAVTNPAKMREVGKVKPNNPGGSPIYVRASGGTMPPADIEPRPSSKDVEVLRTWINCGAKDF